MLLPIAQSLGMPNDMAKAKTEGLARSGTAVAMAKVMPMATVMARSLATAAQGGPRRDQ